MPLPVIDSRCMWSVALTLMSTDPSTSLWSGVRGAGENTTAPEQFETSDLSDHKG